MSIDHHVRGKQIDLGRAIAARKKIYLDLNMWIAARDADAGRQTDDKATQLLEQLRLGVAEGRLICPVSETAFIELMKQPLSEDRRIGTARLVDELSLGVAMIPSQQRIGTEICVLAYRLLGQGEKLHAVHELIWTKVCHVLGQSYPVLAGIDDATQLVLQKGFIDRLWETPLLEMVERIGDAWDRDDPFVDLSQQTNRDRDRHAEEITSFARAYEIELTGAIDATDEMGAEVLCSVGERAGHEVPSPGTDAWPATVNAGKNMLLFAMKKPETKFVLRSLHVEASLHAAMRVDKPRRFKPNDFHDFHHAAAALSYCDAFLTERPLHDLIARKQLGLTALNNCQVASSLGDASELIRTLRGCA